MELAENTVFQGIKFMAGRDIYFYDSGIPSFGTISLDTEIQGIALPSGTEIRFYESGKIMFLSLSGPAVIRGIPLDKGADIFFCENGFPELPDTIDPVKDTLAGGILFKGGRDLALYSSGKPKSGIIAKPLKIDHMKFSDGVKLDFYKSGLLILPEKIYIADDAKIGGIEFKGGFPVGFFKSGNLSSGTLCKNTVIKGIPCKGLEDVSLPCRIRQI
jgi:hypothetical protein